MEFGFTVYPPFRRQGYARGRHRQLRCGLGASGSRCDEFCAEHPAGQCSVASAAAGLGFVRIGSHIDEVDGLEDILGLRLGNDTSAEPLIGSLPNPLTALVLGHRAPYAAPWLDVPDIDRGLCTTYGTP